MPKILPSLGDRLFTGIEDVIEGLNREIVPVLRAVRRAINLISGDTTSITADYTVTLADRRIYADASGGAITITLQSAVKASSKMLTVEKTDSSGNAVTLSSSDNIKGATTYPLAAQYNYVTVFSDATTYHVEADG